MKQMDEVRLVSGLRTDIGSEGSTFGEKVCRKVKLACISLKYQGGRTFRPYLVVTSGGGGAGTIGVVGTAIAGSIQASHYQQ